MAMESTPGYPITLELDYVGEGRSRLSTLLRLPFAVPAWIIAALIGSPPALAMVLILLFRRKYPRWIFDFSVEQVRFSSRVAAYSQLLMDSYPSTDEEQIVHIDCQYPDASELSRWLPLIKWFLAIPHHIILLVLSMGVYFVTALGWVSILFTGKYPFIFFMFVTGVMRWSLRVQAYDSLLITDRYPPFSLS